MRHTGVALRLVSCVLLAVARPLAAQAGVPMGPEFRVNTYTSFNQKNASVASDSSGNFVVVWQDDIAEGGSGSRGIFGQRYASSGTTLGAQFHVNTFTAYAQLLPSVASDSSGNFVVVWSSDFQDGAGAGVFGQRYASSGAPAGAEFLVNTYTTNNQVNPGVASDFSGDFVVVWESRYQDGSRYGVFGQRYASSGAPAGAEFQVNTYTTLYQRSPNVTSDSSGNFVVVWMSSFQDGGGYGIFGQRYASSGAPAGAEFRVNSYTTESQFSPSVASDPSGNFVVVWQSSAQYGVVGQRYASSGALVGTEFLVNTYTTGGQSRPRVASDSSGNFIVVWESFPQDGSNGGIFGRRYASSGAPAGAEFQVNTYTTAGQYIPSVASDSSGDFVVVWQSNRQDGSNYGIFGQRFGKILPVELIRFTVE